MHVYSWDSYLQIYYSKLAGILKHHQFLITSDGIRAREYIDSPLQPMKDVVQRKPPESQLPDIIPPAGLSLQRQW